MPTFAETVRDHYQAGIKDETELLTRLNRIIDEIEPPLTAEKFPALAVLLAFLRKPSAVI